MELASFPASWTDVGDPDPFVELSQGRAATRVEDLLRLVQLVEDLQAGGVKEITPEL